MKARLKRPGRKPTRRGAAVYTPDEEEFGALADAAKAAAERAAASIDDALAFIAASNKRIEALEATGTGRATRKTTRGASAGVSGAP